MIRAWFYNKNNEVVREDTFASAYTFRQVYKHDRLTMLAPFDYTVVRNGETLRVKLFQE